MNVYQVPPGGLSTWRAAQRLMGGMGAHHPRRRLRAYSRMNPIYRMRGLRWLGQDDGLLPSYAQPLPSDLTPSGYVPPPQIGPASVSTVDINPTDVLLPAQQAAASSPYTNVMSQIANALANPTGAPQRTILTPAPVSSVSSLLSSLPSWALPAALVVGGLALVGGSRKGRR